MEILAAIRKKVGPKLIIGMRYGVDEMEPGGNRHRGGVAIGKIFRDSGLVDYLNINRSRIHTDPAMTDLIPVQGMRSAPHLDFRGPDQSRGRDADPSRCAHSGRGDRPPRGCDGKVDMVGMTRAHMADPHIVRKIVEGREGTYPALRGGHLLSGPDLSGGHGPCASTTPRPGGSRPSHIRSRRLRFAEGRPWSARALRDLRPRGWQPSGAISSWSSRWQTSPGGQIRPDRKDETAVRMIGIIDWRMAQCTRLGVGVPLQHLGGSI